MEAPFQESTLDKRNRIFFGLGTVGRDMFYSVVSMYLLVFLTEVLNLPDATMWWITGVLTVLRVFDALNDPIMGILVDNTNSRWGKFKPAMLAGALTGAVFMVLLFVDFGMGQSAYILFFALCYILWDICYGANDIAYWSMLPTLSLEQKQREKTGAFARICANVGMFTVVVGILPVTNAMGDAMGSLKRAWFVFALVVALLMIGFQMFTLLGVKEDRSRFKKEEKTTLKDMWRAIVHNDQLLFTTIAMALFMIGYSTTTSFGVYFFKYAYGNENMYSVFAAVLAVSQLTALAVFPWFSKRFNRRQLYLYSTVLVLIGYLIFFFSPMHMLPLGVAGVCIFTGQAFIQLLMLMFLADTIEYGQWKLGKRNDSVTFSLQPLINKIGGAIASGVVSATVIISGINSAQSAADVTARGLLILKIAMLLLPLLCIVAGYFVYRRKYKIDSVFYAQILGELEARGDIRKNTEV
ncbi:MAG: glycoside-pentoside-hexuronide (GPH):cation symporter [Eubacteriales bacterium]|nr:glycoside-pentoside-hexuronide (GPH):cation symporter [Eubacteriales bacterium]